MFLGVLFVIIKFSQDNNLLKLNHTFPLNYELSDHIEEKTLSLKVDNLQETNNKKYENEEFLQDIVNYIKNELNTIIDEHWNYTIDYYNEENKEGMVQFIYMIDEIRTSKNITFGFSNNILEIVFYKYLDETIDEDALLKRLDLFKIKYHQEKVKLKKNEKFISDSTNYIYFYKADKLIYTYAVYYYESDGLVNNKNATTYEIDINGNIVE